MKASANTDVEPFKSLIVDGLVASFVMANRLTPFAFRIESVRQAGVDATIPYADLKPEDVFSSLVDLSPLGGG